MSEWRLYVCANCDEVDPFRYLQPMPEDASRDASGALDVCPRCDSLYSFVEGGIGEIVVVQKTKGYGDIPIRPSGKA